MINIVSKDKDSVYILSRDKDGNRTQTEEHLRPYYYIKDQNGSYKSLFGDNLKKEIITDYARYKTTKEMRGNDIFEGDIRYTKRVLIDKFKTPLEEVFLRCCYIDIETNSCLDTENVPEPITCISNFDNEKRVFLTFVWRNDLKEERKEESVLIQRDRKDTSVFKHIIYTFNSESEMLKKWISFVRSLDFDIFQGWNILGFDFLYIINRSRKLGVFIDDISFKKRKISFSRNDINIPGRYLFDTFKAYKYSQFKELDSYSLQNVAKEVLQDEKVEIEDFTAVWKTDIDKLIERCRKDVELVWKIDEKTDLLSFFDTIRREVGCEWNDLWGTNSIEDIIFLREAKRMGIVLPSKKHLKKPDKNTGGVVYYPEKGLHKNVIVLDLKSLYPSIITAFGISPETLSETGDVKVSTKFGDYRFDNTKQGICSNVVESLLKKRVQYKNEMLKYKQDSIEHKTYWSKQEVIKRFANKVYGWIANNYSRLHSIECARSITGIGAECTNFSTEQVKKISEGKFKVIYGDTDSIFIKLPDKWDKVECSLEGELLAEKINKTYINFLKEHLYLIGERHLNKNTAFKIEYECLFSEVFFRSKEGGKVSKKRYAANKWIVDSEGKWEHKLEIKGFETIRSDSSAIEKKVMKDIYSRLLNGCKRTEISEVVTQIKKDVVRGKYKLDEIAIRRGTNITLDRTDMYILAARYGEKHLGASWDDYAKLKVLLLRTMPKGMKFPPKTSRGNYAIAYDNEFNLYDKAKKEDWLRCIDWQSMFERLFDKKINLIEESMGWSRDGTKQITL